MTASWAQQHAFGSSFSARAEAMRPQLDRQMCMLVGGAIGGGALGLYLQDRLIRHYEREREKHIEQLVELDVAKARQIALESAGGASKPP